MPKSDTEKTKSAFNTRARAPWSKWWVLLLALCFVGVLLPYVFAQKPTATARMGTQTYTLEIAASEPARVHGLSDRQSLDTNKGMLFVFNTANTQCIWMKDMHFSLDIIWLDAGKKVVKIEQNVSPETYPENFCAEDTKYVVELNAGEVKKNEVSVGTTVKM